MSRILATLAALLLLSAPALAGDAARLADSLTWYGQSTFHTTAFGPSLYIDPLDLPDTAPKADIICITHSHKDHLSPEALKKISTDKTVIVATRDCNSKLKWVDKAEVVNLAPGQSVEVAGVHIEAVPAYNIRKTKYHPKSNKWVGYVVSGAGMALYHAGDTERIPEMQAIDCDVALVPLGQTYTMNSVAEAADSARDARAEIAIPMHYGLAEGTRADAEKFASLLSGEMEVRLLDAAR
ncbi:MBL fold metallo-hydrolase [Desulfocurvus sp.]|uniref:MBL fold metallo-hydrolase n=1 Tax=Desulfocurvus sp. TaxID=2871698 RepID=UPI0025C63D51|nr:MBL fold metallo-hydrolase [Desulfocurvus sp.]MCK9240451.1 MBL fold metallo-hydrolase [Desulfocurvus sp.]